MQKCNTQIMVIASLLMYGIVYAETPDFVVVWLDEGVIELRYEGNSSSPPPIVIVDGEWVNSSGPPDCSKAEHRPVCQSLQAALAPDICGQNKQPQIIAVGQDGKGAQIYCEGNQAAPPPLVVVNGECVTCEI